ncbi:MAG: hypothetical protein J5956_03015 [Ruminococcus sp.]|nr:hypothetical protein [Ruminococcus sp.]
MNEFENAFELDEENECCCGCSCVWKTFVFILIGVVIGFIIAPVKQGIVIGNNNVIKNGKKKKKNKKKSECEEN